MMPERSVPLSELASIIRSKNAGPFRITLDVLFADPEKYQLVRDSGAVTRETVAAAYKINPAQITSFFYVDMANAIKITLRRPQLVLIALAECCTIFQGQNPVRVLA